MPFAVTEAKTLDRPNLITIHGEGGVGKTTLASKAPGVVFICAEDGAARVKVRRIQDNGRDPRSYEDVIAALDAVPKDAKWVCIDTIDAVEAFIHEDVARRNNKSSIADIGYARGYDFALNYIRGILVRIERLRARGVGAIILSHSKIEKFQNPEGSDFDYFGLKLHKKAAELLIEHSDAVLFARREQFGYKGADGKVIGAGSDERYLKTRRTPTYVAKNRFDMPERLPLEWVSIELAIEPKDPGLLVVEAGEVMSQLDEETQARALAAFSKIDKTDARALSIFIDFARSKVKKETTNESE